MCILFWNSNNFTMKFKKVYIPSVYFFGIQMISPLNSKNVYSTCILFWNSVYFFEFHDEIMSGISKDAHLLEFTSSPASLECKSSFNSDKLVWKGTFSKVT